MLKFFFLMLSIVCLGFPSACDSSTQGTQADGDAGGELDADGDGAQVGDDSEVVKCVQDLVAPNQSKDAAYELSASGDIGDLVVCAGSDDWFRLALEEGYDMQVSACTLVGDPAVEFEFFRAEFPEPEFHMGGGHSMGGYSCYGSSTWKAPGTYFFRVWTDLSEASYKLEVIIKESFVYSCPCPAGYICENGICVCRPDELEPNDSAAEASPIEPGREYDLYSCVGDPDMHALDGSAGDTLHLHLETAAVLGHGYFISAALFDSPTAPAPIAFFPKGLQSQDFSHQIPADGTYYLQVENRCGLPREYWMQVEWR